MEGLSEGRRTQVGNRVRNKNSLAFDFVSPRIFSGVGRKANFCSEGRYRNVLSTRSSWVPERSFPLT